MRKIIDRKTAYRAVVLLIALLAVLSIWPGRLWTEVMETSAGGDRIEEDKTVNVESFYSQKFVARYDRLSSVDIYISKVEKGRYFDVTVCDLGGRELIKTLVDTGDKVIPGYVRATLEYHVEVGKEYILYVRGCRSKVDINFETVPDNPEYVGSLYEHCSGGLDVVTITEVPGMHIAAGYNYRIPMSKKISLAVIAVIAAITALLYGLIGLYFSKRPGRNSIITVERCVKFVANPIATVFYLALMIMVFPLKVFDTRAVDIVFYEIGLIVAAGITFYAINHKVVKSEVGISFIDGIDAGNRVRYFLVMLSMAIGMWYSCCCMNDDYDTFRHLSERKMAISFIVMMLLTFSAKEAFNALNLVWLIASGIGGVYYYKQNLFPETEPDFVEKNTAIKYAVIIFMLGGILAINLIKLFASYIHEKLNKNIRVSEERASISRYGIFVYIFFVVLIVMRNGSWWGVALAATFSCLYLRGLVWKGRKDWLSILSGGLMLNFGISFVYCLMFRCFAGYVSGRYGFLFHTQTVTAEYLTVMGAVAAVLLAVKIVALPKNYGVKDLIKTAWKELILFGLISVYAIFTVSRTAYVSLFICAFCVLMCYKKRFGKILIAMIVSVVVCFSPVFTLQRIIPAMVGNPVLMINDDTDPFVRGGAAWGSPNYMCVERFANLFASKILGFDVGTYDYPHDIYNYDPETGKPYLDEYGDPVDDIEENESFGMSAPETDNMLASTQFTNAEAMMLLTATDGDENEAEDDEFEEGSTLLDKLDSISNNRITIYRTYLKEMNLTGHAEQPILPDGMVAYHAHNTYLQVAYDRGVPAGIMFVVFVFGSIVFGLKFFKKNKEKQPLALVPFVIAIGFMVAGMSESVFEFSYPMTPALMLSIFPLMQNNK